LRMTYLTFRQTTQGLDIHHFNAIIEDPRDLSIIVSLRNQNAVVSFRRDGTLKWILGPHELWGPEHQKFLLQPVGEPFEWIYAQHAPRITPAGTLLVYDNGNHRATPFDPDVPDSENYSRVVEYRIDEERMEVEQVWEYGGNIEEPLYTGSVGNAELLPNTGNILVNFGNVSYINHVRPSQTSSQASMARIKEVTHTENPEVVFDLAIFDYDNVSPTYRGNWVYRCYRIPDLYGHMPVPVSDLSISMINNKPMLQFSGDPARSYSIQASRDLKDWSEIGPAQPNAAGEYSFTDATAAAGNYYRVITH
jgi:arylsulfate sulfotransferase